MNGLRCLLGTHKFSGLPVVMKKDSRSTNLFQRVLRRSQLNMVRSSQSAESKLVRGINHNYKTRFMSPKDIRLHWCPSAHRRALILVEDLASFMIC